MEQKSNVVLFRPTDVVWSDIDRSLLSPALKRLIEDTNACRNDLGEVPPQA